MPSRMKREEKNEAKKAIFEAYYNGNVPAEELARRAGTSPRTIYRYLRAVKAGLDPAVVPKKTRPGRPPHQAQSEEDQPRAILPAYL